MASIKSDTRFSRAAFFVTLAFMQRPNLVLVSTKSRNAIEATWAWLFVVPGVLLLAAHLLPVPQNGALAGLPTICVFKVLTGWPCPGCGLTRAIVLCAHGDWSQAFVFHPLGAIFYFALWGALALGVLPALRGRRIAFGKPFLQRLVMIASGTYAAAMIAVWLIRLTGIFPYPSHF